MSSTSWSRKYPVELIAALERQAGEADLEEQLEIANNQAHDPRIDLEFPRASESWLGKGTADLSPGRDHPRPHSSP